MSDQAVISVAGRSAVHYGDWLRNERKKLSEAVGGPGDSAVDFSSLGWDEVTTEAKRLGLRPQRVRRGRARTAKGKRVDVEKLLTTEQPVVHRSLVTHVENWPGPPPSPPVTLDILRRWYLLYYAWCRRCQPRRETRLTYEEFNAWVTGVRSLEDLVNRTRSTLTHVAFWGDNGYHTESRHGVHTTWFSRFGNEPRYVACGGDLDAYAEALRGAVLRGDHVIVQHPPMQGGKFAAANAVGELVTAGREAGRHAVVLGGEPLTQGGFCVRDDPKETARHLVELVLELSPAPRFVVVLTSSKTRSVEARRAEFEAAWEDATFDAGHPATLDYLEGVPSVRAIAKRVRELQESVNDPSAEVVLVPLYYDACGRAIDLVAARETDEVKVATCDISSDWLVRLKEIADRWVGTTAFDPFFIGQAAAMLLINAVGGMAAKQTTLHVPRSEIRWKKSFAKITWDGLRHESFARDNASWLAAHAWLKG